MTSEMSGASGILLVEDDPLDIELTLKALAENHFPHKVTVVMDGEQALDYLYRREKFRTRDACNPRFVLIDNKMPKVTGLEVVKIIKADESLRSIPFVVLTSSVEAPDLREFYKHGVNAYVVKPVDYSKFIRVVKQIDIFWMEINESPPDTAQKERRSKVSEKLSPALPM